MRFIQAGVGGFGKGWLQWLTDHRSVEVVGLVDVDPAALAAAREVAGHSDGICFASLRDALKRVEADALLCATPPAYHKSCAVQAMRAGLDVITEKPLADTLADCKAILRASRDTGRVCVVSQNYRHKPEMSTLARVVASGRIGPIGQVEIDYYFGLDCGGGFRHEMDHPLLIDMAIHHFDLIRHVTGMNAMSVRGESWNPAWSNYRGDTSVCLVFEMANGARVAYNGSWSAKGRFSNWDGNWHIDGNKGALVYENGRIALHKAPRLYTVTGTQAIPLRVMPRTEQDYVLDNFMRSVKRGTRPETDVFDNMHSIAMVFAAVKAVETGKTVPILDSALSRLIADA